MGTRFAPLLFAFLLPPALASAADLKENTQLWSEVDIKTSLSPEWTATFLAVSREGDGLPNPSLWGGGATIDYHIGNWMLTAGDLAVEARSALSGSRLDVNLPLAALTYSWQFDGFLVSDRSRVEDLEGVAGNPWRYRNRLAIERAIVGFSPVSSIFVNDEAFLDLTTGQWTRNRAQVGFALDLIRNTKLLIYYLRQDDRASLPSGINALGTTLVVELP